MKETKELNRLAGKLVNAGFEIADDGKIDFADLPKLFDPLIAGQVGIDNIGTTGAELAQATPAEKDAATEAFRSELTSSGIDEGDRYDIAQIFAGIQSGRSMVARKSRRQTLEELAPLLNTSVVPQSGEGWTAETLEALLDG